MQPLPTLTKEDFMNAMTPEELDRIVSRLGDRLWVVMNKSGTSLLKDPGTGMPFKTYIRKFADLTAKETGGVCVTYKAAYDRLLKLAAG